MILLAINSLDWVLVAVATIVVVITLILQIKSFKETRSKILELANFFPNIAKLQIKQSSISSETIVSKAKLESFLLNPTPRIVQNDDEENDEDIVDVDLIGNDKSFSRSFFEVVNDTNAYLCKNVGTSADFEIIENICERKIDAIETQIQNTINIPLYLGLAGTFIGIIVGLSGIVFNIDGLLGGATMSTQIQTLLIGVVIAMVASFVGLGLMTWNSAVVYKKALSNCYNNKNSYFDFIRRELMPSLSNSMSASLNSLKSVLGEFIGKFGHNLNDYANSAELLNDNIEKQHLLLVEINRMNQTQMATTIAETFDKLNKASQSLSVFNSYQESLNSTIQGVEGVVNRLDEVVTSFDDFSESLSVVVENQNIATELQSNFRAAIEQHFPLGSEARDQWRKHFDELTSDAAAVSSELNNQLKASTEHIQNFTENNKEAFRSLSKLNTIFESLVQYSNVQAECYKDLKTEIASLRENQIKQQSENAKLNADLLTAVKEMTNTVKSIKSKL